MKVAILYICTGRYSIFWNSFYSSSEEYFLNEAIKHYFVFTDEPGFLASNINNVTFIKQVKLGWPMDSLGRFGMFNSIRNRLLAYDYIYFFNANLNFLKKVGEEILPTPQECGLTAVLHPYCYLEKDNNKFFYDRNKRSRAFVPFGKGENYYQGCLNGGTRDAYLKLVEVLEENVQQDLKRNVIARWHDESHLNHYLLKKKIRQLLPVYAYPEGIDIGVSEEPIILSLDKNKFGGHEFLREEVSHIENRASIEKLHEYRMNSLKKIINRFKSYIKKAAFLKFSFLGIKCL